MREHFSTRPLAMHGTSREAVVALFERGVLPADGREDEYAEWFYFTPVSRYYNRSRYALRVGRYTLSEAFSIAKFYAQAYSREHHLHSCLRYYPSWWGNQVDTPANHRRWFEWEFKRKKNDPWVRTLVDEMWERKGFVIEPSAYLFEEFHYKRGDDPTMIAVRCPKGLPRECVNAVVPLGSIERGLLRDLKKNLNMRSNTLK